MGSAPDPTLRVRGPAWTIADVAAHVATFADSYVGYLDGTVAPVVHVRTVKGVARTLGRSWPISRTDAIIIFEALTSVAQWFVEPTRASDGVFEINVRHGPSYTLRFMGGSLTVEPDRVGRPDCRIWADPRALTLVLYGRLNQWRAILRGQLIAGGRRPWRALTFTARFSGI